MKKYLYIPALALIAFLYGCTHSEPLPQTTEDGLTLNTNSSIDELYVRQGFKLEDYKQLDIEAIKLSYSDEMRNKLPNLRDEDYELSEKEMTRFQERADKGFSTGIERDKAEKSTLIVKHTITDFYLTSPIKLSINTPDKSFVHDSSRFTLVTEFIDAETQQVVLRATDKIKTGDRAASPSNLSRHSSVTFWQDVYQAFRSWGNKINGSFEQG